MKRYTAVGLSFVLAATIAACAAGPGANKSPERVAAERACTHSTYERYGGEGWSQTIPITVVDRSCVRRRLSGNR